MWPLAPLTGEGLTIDGRVFAESGAILAPENLGDPGPTRGVLSLPLATATLVKAGPLRRTERGIALGDTSQDLMRHGTFLVNHHAGRYKTVRPARVIAWGLAKANDGKLPEAATKALKGKIVVLGINLVGQKDVLASPMGGDMDGPVWQATVLDNLLHGDGRVRVWRVIDVILLALLCVLAGVLGTVLPTRWLPHLVPLALAGLMAWLCGATAIAGGCWRLAAWSLEGVLGTLDAIEESHSELLYRHLQARLFPVILAVAGLALGLLPGEWRSKVVASVLVLPLVIGLRHPSRSSDRFSLTVLDVGQGTAVVIESGERALLYDTGGGDPAGLNMAGSVVLPYLRHAGITELEQVVVSHADTDHSAGLPLLQQSIPIGELWLNRPRPGLESGLCRAGVSWRWPDGVEFRFLGPAARPPPSENDASCVLQVSVDGRRFLLPGDISKGQERDLLRYWQSEVESEWLLAGHHGSNTSTAASWLRRVGPLEVVYGRGFGNPFGHPHPAVAGRVARWGATVGDTALQGALSYRLGPDGAWRRVAHRDTRRRYWLH